MTLSRSFRCHISYPILDQLARASGIGPGMASPPHNVEPTHSFDFSLVRHRAMANTAWWVCARRRLPDIAWRDAIAAPEGTIEVRKVAKTHGECDGADVPIGKTRIAQHPVCKRKALAPHKGREGEAFVLEQLVDVSRCHALALRDLGDRQLALAEMS